MRPEQLRGGMIDTLDLMTEDAAPSQGTEVAFVAVGDEILLQWGGSARPVRGVDEAAHDRLVDVVGSRQPVVAWIASARGGRLTIQVHRFTSAVTFEGALEIGVDEQVAEDVRRLVRFGGTPDEVSRWLDEQLLLRGGEGSLARAVIHGGPRASRDAFRIIGRSIAVDVRRTHDRLRIDHVVRGGRTSGTHLQLLTAPLRFVDATAAGPMAASTRHALEQAVLADDSYLQIWLRYNQLEREAVLRRARRIGSLVYDRAERRADGGWRFFLRDGEELDDRLAALGDSERFELEAGESAPDWSDAAEQDERRTASPHLSAPLVGVDVRRRVLDLRGPEDDEEQTPPPHQGYLFLSLAGDRTRLRRREEAELRIRTAECGVRHLGLVLEDRPAPQARRRRRRPDTVAVRRAFGGTPTQRQLEALDIALNTPDVALIQGPPGTGKTKVITALQRRLAELAEEGMEVSHRVLVSSAQHEAVENVVQRSEVFGLPAMKVGRRRGDDGTTFDSAEAFRRDRAERLRSALGAPSDGERMAQARRIAVACMGAPSSATETARRLGDLRQLLDDLLPPELADRLSTRIDRLQRPARTSGDPEGHELRLSAARGIRVEPPAFEDDGPRNARKALARLDGVLRPDEAALLQRCADWDELAAPRFLAEVRALRDGILDRLLAADMPAAAALDAETHQLLTDVMDTLELRRRRTAQGEEAVLATFLEDLENDPGAIESAIRHYTVVLAATCQQAAGRAMRLARHVDEGSVTFESVIVDEAARANPLDLFIPMSMANRRVVLVGDHRQLPHMLEPDVERDLRTAVERGDVREEALEAMRHSLFQRLWDILRRLEARDGIRRTVTLDVQYRMHPVLGDFVSRAFYDGALGSTRPAGDFAHDLPGYAQDGRARVAAWIDVPGGRHRYERGGRSKARPAEAKRIAKEVRRLIEHDETLSFGVIAFYADQVEEIGRAFVGEGLAEQTDEGGWHIAERWRRTEKDGRSRERLRVGTVDAFQGREFDVVFLSVTRSNDHPEETDAQRRKKYGHLLLENRLCVAMSRQQRLLVAVGDLAFIRSAAPLTSLRAFAQLCEGPDGVVRT